MSEYHADKVYLSSLKSILDNGTVRKDRTGVGTIGIFGSQEHYDLTKGFPLLTTKKVYPRGVFGELLFFLTGRTDNQWLNDRNIHIWDDWRRPYTLDRPLIVINKKFAVYSIPVIDVQEIIKEQHKHQKSLDKQGKDIFNTWKNMMLSCYDKTHYNYKYYGGNGTTVVDEWKEFSVFLKAVKTLPHWRYKTQNWNSFELDKDYYGSNQYGPNSCVWLHKDENKLYMKSVFPIRITDLDGNEEIYISLSEAYKKTKIPTSTLSRFVKVEKIDGIVKGKNKKYKNYKFEKISLLEGELLRPNLISDDDLGPIYGYQWRHFNNDYVAISDLETGAEYPENSVDQVLKVLNDLKNNPFSRRHIISAWNPSAIDSMALPPCHTMFQFYVTPDAEGNPYGLSCQLYQRSRDTFLGSPFNIASYSALTHLFADLVGLKPLSFVHTTGDAHIYLNHLEKVKEQISRENDIRDMPTLKINHPVPLNQIDLADPTIFNQYAPEDFELVGYNPLPAIKAPIAI